MTHDPLKDGEPSERWLGEEAPLTPQAEEAMLKRLEARARELLQALQALEGLETWQTACVKLLAATMAQGDLRRCQATARTLMENQQPQTPCDQLAQELTSVLANARCLQVTQPLVGPLAQETTSLGFMKHVAERPEDLVRELLCVGDATKDPADNLRHNIQNLREILLPWGITPSVQALHVTLYDDLLETLTALVVSLSRLEEDLRRDFLGLLRWRLERCDDLLALPEVWRLPHWLFDLSHMFFSSAVRLTTTLWERTSRDGRAPLSVSTWDAVFTVLMELMAQADEAAMNVAAKIEARLILEVEHMDAEVDTVARLLRGLEREGLSGLPQEMRETFVRNALYRGVAEGLVGVLQEVKA